MNSNIFNIWSYRSTIIILTRVTSCKSVETQLRGKLAAPGPGDETCQQWFVGLMPSHFKISTRKQFKESTYGPETPVSHQVRVLWWPGEQCSQWWQWPCPMQTRLPTCYQHVPTPKLFGRMLFRYLIHVGNKLNNYFLLKWTFHIFVGWGGVGWWCVGLAVGGW